MLILFGKMEIPVVQSPSLNTTPTAKCTSVEGMLDELTRTILKRLQRRRNFRKTLWGNSKTSFQTLKHSSANVNGTSLAMGVYQRHSSRELELTTSAFFNSAIALKIMQSVCVLFPNTTAETFIPGMEGHVGSTLNVLAVVINVRRMKNPVV